MRIAMAIPGMAETGAQTDDEQPWLRVPVRAPAHGTQTILVVDDEPMVRAFTSEILALEGYVVLDAAGTAEGLRIAATDPGPIDLVISDVVLPDGDGRDLVERLERIRPTMRALYMSGHIEADLVRGGGLRSAAFLQKPFTMDTLVEKVRAVLAAAEPRIVRV
jgi:two-component system cell cycle sensor histidine kinase/response regulator CckA